MNAPRLSPCFDVQLLVASVNQNSKTGTILDSRQVKWAAVFCLMIVKPLSARTRACSGFGKMLAVDMRLYILAVLHRGIVQDPSVGREASLLWGFLFVKIPSCKNESLW